MESIGDGRGAFLLGLCVVVAFLLALVGVSSARAANTFVSAGEITAGELTGPARIAVDEETGNVLVVDSAKNRVDVFDSSGPGASLLTSFGEADLSGPYGIAIDQSNGNVYVTDPGNEQILRYETDGNPTPAYTLDAGYTGPAAGSGSDEVGSFTSAIGVDLTNGNLLVADRGTDRVSRFTSAGAFVSSFDGADSTAGAFTHLEDLTLSPAGKIFVADGEATAGSPSRVLRFSNAGAYEATLREPAATGDAYLAYDAKHTELIVGDGRECFFCPVSIHVLDPASGVTLFDVSVPGERITGLASDIGSGRLYAAIGEVIFPPKVQVFAPQMHAELVLDAPGPVTATSIHLSGTVDPGGVATEYHFEVSKDGGSTWQKSPDASAGEGTTPVAVEADLAVEPNTSYVAKLVATNTDGAQDATPTQPFTTEVSAPKVEALPASDLGETSAVINGQINPFGLQTTYYFEYGPTTAYGTKVPAGTEGTAGNGRVLKSFSRTLSGLTPGATYHFRLVATSSAGMSQGADQTFSTEAPASLPVRAYEQVTPADKGSVIVTVRLGFRAAPDGGAISYLAKSGPQGSPIFSRYVALRGPSDWQGAIGTDPPAAVATQAFQTHLTLGVSDDFSHAMVVSNRALAPGATEGNANLYRTDLATGSFEFIGGSGAPEALNSFTGSFTSTFQAGAPDFSWVYFFSREPLLPGAPRYGMYRWSVADGLELASELPNGEGASTMKPIPYGHWQPASADGTRFYFSADPSSGGAAYLREGGVTKVVSHAQGDPTTPLPGILLGTNEDGRYAFLTSGAELTNDAPGFGDDLYRYDASDGSLEYLGGQAFVDTSNCGADGCTIFYGSFGIGADGNTIYFDRSEDPVGQLVQGFSVWHDGEFRHILDEELGVEKERYSPSGRYFAFTTTVDGVAGVLQRYDAETDQIECASCRPDGTPVSAALAIAGPDYTINNDVPISVGDDGTVYFDTAASLVDVDVNGTRDVYTWNDGKLTLISPGDKPFDALLGDASPDGSDVFFTTAQGLVKRDIDNATDVYDARVNGGLPFQNLTPPEECQRSCKAPPTSQAAQPPVGATEVINGPGNVKPHRKKSACGKGKHKAKVKGKKKCVKNGKKRAGKNKKGGNR